MGMSSGAGSAHIPKQVRRLARTCSCRPGACANQDMLPCTFRRTIVDHACGSTNSTQARVKLADHPAMRVESDGRSPPPSPNLRFRPLRGWVPHPQHLPRTLRLKRGHCFDFTATLRAPSRATTLNMPSRFAMWRSQPCTSVQRIARQRLPSNVRRVRAWTSRGWETWGLSLRGEVRLADRTVTMESKTSLAHHNVSLGVDVEACSTTIRIVRFWRIRTRPRLSRALSLRAYRVA